MSLQTEELSEWIQTYSWRYFITVTNRRPRKDAISFMRDINQTLTDRETELWSDPDGMHLPSRLFIACEPHRYQDNLHAHGLCNGLDSLYSPRIMQKALQKRFGRSDVSLIRTRNDVATYCSKYVTKWKDGDNYDYFGNW